MFGNLFDSSNETMWTAIGAVGQIVAAAAAIFALVYSFRTFTKSLKTLHYTELDRMYLDILKIRLERRYLNPNVERNPGEQREYDNYAFMIWNFLETIHDRCERDNNLCATWYPVIDAEEGLYWAWFKKENNKPKFKESFRTFVDERFRLWSAEAGKTGDGGKAGS